MAPISAASPERQGRHRRQHELHGADGLRLLRFGPTFTDVWWKSRSYRIWANVRVGGQWKQPFSLEVVSSFRYTTFMERSLLFQPFTPFRHLGVGFYDVNEQKSATWAASVFRTGQDQSAATSATTAAISMAARARTCRTTTNPRAAVTTRTSAPATF